jgi:cytochrome b561
MALGNSRTRYGWVTMTLHWGLAVALVFMIWFGLAMYNMDPDGTLLGMNQFTAYQLHKSIGFTILVLALARLIWRWANPTPSLPSTLKRWERIAAHTTHIGLYILMIAIPVAGWIMVSASPWQIPTVIYGLFELPHLVGPSEALESAMITVHATLAFLLLGLIALHVGAALKHHFILKDDVLKRMLPFTRVGRDTPL